MRAFNPHILIALFGLTLASCVEEYWPDYSGEGFELVVEGEITNLPPPYSIRLSYSGTIENNSIEPVHGARVVLVDSLGETEEFLELMPGVYNNKPDGMWAKEGHYYRVLIELRDGRKLETKFERIKSPAPIDSLYAVRELKETDDPEITYDGYQFYVDTRSGSEVDRYFLWRLSETYEFNSNFKIDYIFRGMGLEKTRRNDSLFTCWKTQDINNYYLLNNEFYSDNLVRGFSLNYVSNYSRKITVKYSLLATQYMISKEAYNFYSSIKEQSEESGGLNTRQPFQTRGNVFDANNGDYALGYIIFAGVNRKRIFVDPPSDIDYFYLECTLNTDLTFVFMSPPDQYPIYFLNSGEGLGFANDLCFDCTLLGGNTFKPIFWED